MSKTNQRLDTVELEIDSPDCLIVVSGDVTGDWERVKDSNFRGGAYVELSDFEIYDLDISVYDVDPKTKDYSVKPTQELRYRRLIEAPTWCHQRIIGAALDLLEHADPDFSGGPYGN